MRKNMRENQEFGRAKTVNKSIHIKLFLIYV